MKSQPIEPLSHEWGDEAERLYAESGNLLQVVEALRSAGHPGVTGFFAKKVLLLRGVRMTTISRKQRPRSEPYCLNIQLDMATTQALKAWWARMPTAAMTAVISEAIRFAARSIENDEGARQVHRTALPFLAPEDRPRTEKETP